VLILCAILLVGLQAVPPRLDPTPEAAHWTFRELPGGGPVAAVATDPSHPSRLFAGGKGLFRSDDYGETWSTLSQNLRPTVLAVDPSNGDRLYVVSDGALWSSLDGGASWRVLIPPHPPGTLLIDSAGTLYADSSGEIFKSGDLGYSWSSVSSGLPGYATLAAVDPVSPGALYAIAWDAGGPPDICESVDSGDSWAVYGTPLDWRGAGPIAVSATKPRMTYIVASRLFPSAGTLFASGDGEFFTWGSAPIFAIACDPVRPEIVYASVPIVEFVYAVAGPYSATQLGQRGFAPNRLTVAPDGSFLYGIDYAGRFATLPLEAPVATTRTVKFR
jgi:photosystem II stability/assembly factor-like uncharacterized protein